MAAPNSPSPITRFGIFVLIAGVMLVFVLWGILHYLADRAHPTTRASNGAVAAPAPVATTAPSKVPTAVDPERAAAMAQLNESVSLAMAVLRDPKITDKEAKKAALDALKEALRGADPKVAVAVIRQFLDSKQDAQTGLAFKVGEDHEMETSPTMRTFMMDQLGDISLGAQLSDAVDVARATLESKDSADEWALAMRNIALADPEGSKGYLAGKAKELLEYAPWQQQPTGGYLEAFDVGISTGDPSIIQDLGAMHSASNSMLAGAARVALQRMSAVAPEQVASYLNTNPNVLSDYPNLRADYMGSVDLSSPTQLSQAETYLARTDVTDAEKSKFIARLGLQAGFVADTLVTPSDVVQMPVLEHRDLVNKTATQWLDSGKYPTLQPALQKVIEYTTSTAGGNG